MNTPSISVNLAATLTSDMTVEFPKYASAKYDGIRAVIIGGAAYSRNMILIPNLTVQKYFADGMCDGFDGELICGRHDKEVFKRTSSVIRKVEGGSAWHFKVFDVVPGLREGCHVGQNFASRLQLLREAMLVLQDEQKYKVSIVAQHLVLDDAEITSHEEECLSLGYEGSMLRNPNALYKNGRATPKSQDLLKVKRFEDSEAIVLGWTPLVDKDGVVRPNLMGSLQVRDILTGIEFSVGSGFDLADRLNYSEYPPIGKIFTYQFFAQGAYVKPRFPTFKGFRDDVDFSMASYAKV